MNEIFVDIKGYEGLYQISNMGTVKSMERTFKICRGYRTQQEIIKKDFKSKHGYMRMLLNKNGVKINVKIHRLVAAAFIPNVFNKPDVNHIDGNKLNNNASNLEWCTKKENIQHSYKMGLQRARKGSESHLAKLNDKMVIEIIRRGKSEKTKVLAKEFNTSASNINFIKNGTTWNHITFKNN